ncbi:DEAD/DEAH box helicase [Photobacterium gaetbulicola]|uniref:DEAD/DEAH box helicase n=1 Tax=Photobacterium gaetbulicola TaxID=1295392 RepID=A0A0B9GXR8_9GAMM|nr:DEAD/DEAH box helicase [Photobacterium gaetbulicola]KHT63546.1 DEAD/DEAH box helicase [Photobacterium gaetbulicola]
MSTKAINFTALYKDLTSVTSQAVINRLQLKSEPLRKFLQHEFSKAFGQRNSFFAEPVFEATFGWEPAAPENTLDGLQEKGLLTASMVRNLSAPPMPAPETEQQEKAYRELGIDQSRWADDIQEDYTWPVARQPYRHQLEAWEHLSKPEVKSVVVTSGTGSGKTECFLVPLLNDLARQADAASLPLEGTQAIFLYPLNALINSQRERLSAWTRGFEGKVRFALYNGDTPEQAVGQNIQNAGFGPEVPEQVTCRRDIWASPPPVLVTNSTMLEYMLVRQKDEDILAKSQGKLKWIVLDEAHTYVGSQAAEISLLLRRVMHAYGVTPEQVRFVATSATIGDKTKQAETNEQLQTFLAKLAGVNVNQVEVVNGQRQIPALEEKAPRSEFSIEYASTLSSGDLFDYLCAFSSLKNLRLRLTKEAMTLHEIASVLSPDKPVGEKALRRALEIIDLAVTAYPGGNVKAQAFIPVRAHVYHRSQRGFWACMDPNCCNKQGTALENGWEFGMIYTHERSHCEGECGAPVFELTHCASCSTPSLSAVKNTAEGGVKLIEARENDLLDDYADEIEHRLDDETEQDDENVPEQQELASELEAKVQIFNKEYADTCTSVYIDPKTNRLSDPDNSSASEHASIKGHLALHYTQSEREDGARCACCKAVENVPNTMFKRAILGSPFLMGSLVPAMLRHIPSDNPDDMKGKRLITFTDSRQGTARFSAKMQLDCERNWGRSHIYRHALQHARNITVPPELQGQRDSIEALKSIPGQEAAVTALQTLLDASLAMLEPTLISWDKLKEKLAETDEIQLLSGAYAATLEGKAEEREQERLPGEYARRVAELNDAKRLAELFLLREFSRRSKNANNLESMGLVQLRYTAINRLSDFRCPEWSMLGFDLDDLKSYLKICMDFFIRENTYVDIDPDVINWMGAKIMPRLVQASDYTREGEEELSAVRLFPKVNNGTQHRLVRLLEIESGRSAKANKALFNIVLDFVWKMLVHDLKLLTKVTRQSWRDPDKQITGYHLKFDDKVELAPIDKAWLCPVTNRWLDTTFKGLTPYTTGTADREDVYCGECLTIAHPEPALLDQPIADIRDWLDDNEQLRLFKDKGLWSDINDKVVAGVKLLRAAEHSAQQESGDLKQLEKAFKKDHLNVLSCSTTMEMGVDIGSLSMVVMNNVPPSTSNYLQRAGRAGRRQEPTALALTFCKSTPHGERVFREPKWPFVTPIRVPKVSLDCGVIVQRHINAFLLASFLKLEKKKSDNLLVMQAGAFFRSDAGVAPFEAFDRWLVDLAQQDSLVITGIETLKFDSAYANYSNKALIEKAAEAMERASSKWCARYDALAEQLEQAAPDNNGARNKLAKQLERIEKDYLLATLADSGYLPGYGFPTGVVQLYTNNRSENIARNDDQEARKAYPSRSLAVALREYAPGAEIVKNGAVYQSQGLQLNWKMPFAEGELKEGQLLQYQWECDNCCCIGIEDTSVERMHKRCTECDSERLTWKEFIVPSGFVVDYNKPLHNNYIQPNYVGHRDGKVAITGSDWQPLSEDGVGRFKVSDEGIIFHYNDGAGGGYALCWCCGRAESLPVEKTPHGTLRLAEEPHLLSRHRRLQGTQIRRSGAKQDKSRQPAITHCESQQNSWGVKLSQVSKGKREIETPFIMGYPEKTAMFELQLKNPQTGNWISDEKWMYTLGAALRQMYAEQRGITTQELGLTVKAKRSEAGQSIASLFIYDTATQGAGFSTAIPEALITLWPKLEKYLSSCPGECQSVCHSCLLDYDTQFNIKKLDRHYLLAQMRKTKLLTALALPEERQYFGASSRAELATAQQLLAKSATTCSSVDFFILEGEWSWGDWPVRQHILALCAKNIPVNIYLSASVAESIDGDLAWEMTRYLPSASVSVHTLLKPVVLQHGGLPLMHLALSEGSKWFAVNDPVALSANGSWGLATDSSLVSSREFATEVQSQALDLDALAKSSELNKAVIIDDFTSLRGNVWEFGKRFVELIEESAPDFATKMCKPIEAVTYSDPYVVSPLSVILVNSIFRELDRRYGKFSADISTAEPQHTVLHKGKPEERLKYPPVIITNNLLTAGDVCDFVSESAMKMRSMFEDNSQFEAYAEVYDKKDLPHGRIMVITLQDGDQVKLLFDHGMGYWGKHHFYKHVKFPFNSLVEGVDSVPSWNFDIQDDGKETFVAVKI